MLSVSRNKQKEIRYKSLGLLPLYRRNKGNKNCLQEKVLQPFLCSKTCADNF